MKNMGSTIFFVAYSKEVEIILMHAKRTSCDGWRGKLVLCSFPMHI